MLSFGRETAAAGCVNFGKKWKTGTARQYFADIISSTTVTLSACKAIEYGERKRKIRAITPFKVIQGHRVGTNRKPVILCDFLLVINSNWHPTQWTIIKRDILFLTITSANHNRFFIVIYHFNREEILHATIITFITSLDLCAHLTWKN